MGPMIAAAVLPVREDHARFAERADQLAVEAFLAEAAVETFGVSVPPRAARIDA